jgi:DNA-binding transcriptional ArsR family regulator
VNMKTVFFVFTTPVNIRRWAQLPKLSFKLNVTHRGEATKKSHMPSNLLGPLITSKTRLKLLLRFFLNQNLSGYLQGLSKELGENTNSVRVELNRLEEAGLLSAEEQGRRKVYSVNTTHPLTTDISNMLRKVTGIDALVDRVVSRIGDTLEKVWITGALAIGINSDELDVTLVGEALDTDYLYEVISKVEILIEKTITWQVSSSEKDIDTKTALLVWQKQEEQ